jgi:hypothetical protein
MQFCVAVATKVIVILYLAETSEICNTSEFPGAYSSVTVGTFPMAPAGAYPTSPPIVSSAMPPPGNSFVGAA